MLVCKDIEGRKEKKEVKKKKVACCGDLWMGARVEPG